jgi:hypothetical protein
MPINLLLASVVAAGLATPVADEVPADLARPWCGVLDGGARECVYVTLGQCVAVMQPQGGDCQPRD